MINRAFFFKWTRSTLIKSKPLWKQFQTMYLIFKVHGLDRRHRVAKCDHSAIEPSSVTSPVESKLDGPEHPVLVGLQGGRTVLDRRAF